jgi:hypothetical protein
MRIEARGLIQDASAAPDSEKVASFTALCVLRSGTILATCQLGPGKHALTSTVALFRSADDGQNWTRIDWTFPSTVDGVPGSLSGGELVEAEPGRLLLFATWFDRSDPDRPLLDPVTEGILPSKQLLAVSADDGATWTAWQEVATPALTGCSLTGPPLRWTDGTLAVCFESFKTYDDPAPGRHGAWLLVSTDGGRTFGEPVCVAQHPEHSVYYWDQRLCVGPAPHSFIALFWTHDLRARQDLTVHLRSGTLRDLTPGAAAAVTATTIPGQIAAPLLLADGRLLAFVVNRGRPGTMTLWQSADGGSSWPAERSLTVHTHDERAALTQGTQDIDFAAYWEDMGRWSFGHPAIRPLPDDRVLLAYYAGTPDRMSLHWARVHLA